LVFSKKILSFYLQLPKRKEGWSEAFLLANKEGRSFLATKRECGVLDKTTKGARFLIRG